MDANNLESVETLWHGKWIKVIGKTYRVREDKTELWECIERTTRKSDVDGVDVMATFDDQGTEKMIVIANFRAPVQNFVLELPAGLLDEGEDY
jgi:ADP-ribose pyrophosphatase